LAEEYRRKAIEEAKKKSEETERLKAEELAKKADQVRKRAEEEAKKRADMQAKQKAEEEAKRRDADRLAARKTLHGGDAKANEERLDAAASIAARNKQLEEEAIRQAEEGLREKLRSEKANAEIDAKIKLRQEEADKKFKEAKILLEQSGAEFVGREEFEKLREEKNARAAGAA